MDAVAERVDDSEAQAIQTDIGRCIACRRRADERYERLSACLCHDSIVYEICVWCEGSAKSEALIEERMKQANLARLRKTV
jgi:hypothetical protein